MGSDGQKEDCGGDDEGQFDRSGTAWHGW
jgi:hypothetical protein